MDLPPRALAWVLGVELAAVAAVVASVDGPPPPQALGLAALLALLAVVHTELATGIERIRRRVAQTSYFDLSSVWTFAAALLLPPPLAAAVVVVGLRAPVAAGVAARRGAAPPPRLHDRHRRARRHGRARGRHGGGRAPGGPGGRGRGAGRRRRGARLRRGEHRAHRRGHRAVPARDRRRGSSWGAGTTTRWRSPRCAWARWPPWRSVARPLLVALALPPILVLHRAVRVRHLEEAASLDGKTGLLNAATWHDPADRAVRATRAGRAAARACSSSTSTTSRRSTTARPPRGRRRAGRGRRGAARRACAARTSSAGSAARSSWCSSGRCRRGAGRAGRAGRRRASGCGARSPSSPSPCPPRTALVIDGLSASVGAASFDLGRTGDARQGARARPTPACTRPSAAGATACASRGRPGAVAVPAPRAAGDALRRADERGRRGSVSWSA